MDKLIPTMPREQARRVSSLLFLLTVASGYYTFEGVSIDAVGFAEHASRTVFAIASAIAILLFWIVVWAVVPRLEATWARVAAWLGMVVGLLLILNLSTIYNATALSNGEGLEIHLERHVSKVEETGAIAHARALSLDSVASALRAQSANYATKAESELKHGAYSGAPGRGAVYFALQGLKTRIDALLDEVEAFRREAANHGKALGESLSEMRTALGSGAPYRGRVDLVARATDALRRRGSEMDPAALAATVGRTLEALPDELALYTQLSGNQRLAERQKAALAKLRSDIAGTTSVLQDLAGELADTPPVRFPAFERLTPTQSVYVYWRAFVPAIAGGIALDIAPAVIVFFAALMLGSTSKDKRQRWVLGALSVEDLAKAQGAIQLLRGIALPRRAKIEFQGDLFGEPDGGHFNTDPSDHPDN